MRVFWNRKQSTSENLFSYDPAGVRERGRLRGWSLDKMVYGDSYWTRWLKQCRPVHKKNRNVETQDDFGVGRQRLQTIFRCHSRLTGTLVFDY